jgi:hypothetical protein
MASVLMPFRDRLTWVAYRVGDSYDGTPERIRELVSAGYVQSGLIAQGEVKDGSESATVDFTGNLDELTVQQLRELAEARGIEVPRRARKSDLISILGA